MSKQMNWVAFFSQTGSEIVNICERINKWPNLIVSNRQDGFEKINPKLISGKTRVLFVEKSRQCSGIMRLLEMIALSLSTDG